LLAQPLTAVGPLAPSTHASQHPEGFSNNMMTVMGLIITALGVVTMGLFLYATTLPPSFESRSWLLIATTAAGVWSTHCMRFLKGIDFARGAYKGTLLFGVVFALMANAEKMPTGYLNYVFCVGATMWGYMVYFALNSAITRIVRRFR
jgi:hypothetical protein